jgi:methylmalonyl-CoA carboxyltransferase 1.3S subunit
LKLQIAIDGRTYEVEVEVAENDATPRLPNYGPYPPIPATVQFRPAPVPRTPSRASGESLPQAKVCRSPVAGVVIKVNVQSGQELQANDLMIVLEAMKMETNITAPAAGAVKTVCVAPGDAVKVNQIVVEFE